MIQKIYNTLCLLFLAGLLFSSQIAQCLAVPDKPDNYVNDYANLLSYGNAQALDNKLRQFQRETTNQIVVAIFPSLENESLVDFSTRLEQHWKIGQKGKDNGILLVIFVKEHQVRIEVGYGLEAYVPDALAGQIIQADIIPNFQTQHFDVGINSAIDALILATKDAYAPASHKKRIDTGLQPFYPVLAILMLLAALLFFVIMFRRWMKTDTLAAPPAIATASSKSTSDQQDPPTSDIQTKPNQTGWLWFLMVLAAIFGGRDGNDRFRGDGDSFDGGGGGRSGGGGASGQW